MRRTVTVFMRELDGPLKNEIQIETSNGFPLAASWLFPRRPARFSPPSTAFGGPFEDSMNEPYCKLACSILDSSIWRQDDCTRIIWITLLAMKGADGVVRASIGGIADRAKKTEAEAKTAMEKFLAPDLDSKNEDHDGRRIERVAGGWQVLNHEFYRNMFSQEETRSYERDRKASQRARNKAVPNVPDKPGLSQMSRNVPQSDQIRSDQIKEKEYNSIFEGIGELKRCLERWLDLPEGRRWPEPEERMMAEIVQRPHFTIELRTLQDYQRVAKGYFPQSTWGLLEKWDHHVQVAGSQKPEPPKSKKTGADKSFDRDMADLDKIINSK